jgi:hypothetical protein
MKKKQKKERRTVMEDHMAMTEWTRLGTFVFTSSRRSLA